MSFGPVSRRSAFCGLQKSLAANYRKVGHPRETNESTLQADLRNLVEARLLSTESHCFAVHLAL